MYSGKLNLKTEDWLRRRFKTKEIQMIKAAANVAGVPLAAFVRLAVKDQARKVLTGKTYVAS